MSVRFEALRAISLVLVVSCGDSVASPDASSSSSSSGEGTSSEPETESTEGGTTSSPDESSESSADASTGEPEEPIDIDDALAMIDGLSVTEVDSNLDGYRVFALVYQQPLDHANPEGPSFGQRMWLQHRSPDDPMVLVPLGYGLYDADDLVEPASRFDTNQLVIEHRYFLDSRPWPVDWTWLSIEQAAADVHRIVSQIRPLYERNWVSQGISKGGMTAIYHRRFYPDDVDATIAYVAPSSSDPPDERYREFFDQLGGPDCQERLPAFQTAVLERREEVMAAFMALASERGWTYEVLGHARALELAVLDFRFQFWTKRVPAACPLLADPAGPVEQILEDLHGISELDFYADENLDYGAAYFVQAGQELGWPDVSEAHLDGLRQFTEPSAPQTYAPVELVFQPGKMADIEHWVSTEGERIMLITGEYDPWSHTTYDVSDSEDSWHFVVPEGDHGARIGHLSVPDRDQALSIVARWLGVDPRRASVVVPKSVDREPVRRTRGRHDGQDAASR